MAIPPALLAQGAQQGMGAIMGLAGGFMQKRSRKKAMRRMEQKAQETRDRFDRKAADARSSFGGTRRTIEALRTSSDVQFQEARTTAARLQKSALQNRQLARRGGGTPEQQAQMLGMGNMQEYLAQRAGRMENVQRLTQMEAGVISQQQQLSAEILKTGAGAESVWSEAQAKLMSQEDPMGAGLAAMGSAMMSMKPGAAAAAPDVNAGATAAPNMGISGVSDAQNSLTASGTGLTSIPDFGMTAPGEVPGRIPGLWEIDRTLDGSLLSVNRGA